MFGPELAADIGRRHGAPVEMTHLSRGIFDEASVSVITPATVAEIGRLAARPLEIARFRPNMVIATPGGLKAIVRERDNKAGVYATVVRRGPLACGQRVFLEPSRRT